LAFKPLRFVKKGARILRDRLRKHGLKTTAVWVYGRGIAKLTGVPPLRFSRVTPNLYVGPQYSERGFKHLKDHGVTAGVNLRVEYDDAAHGLAFANYCHLPTIDDDAPTLEHLAEGATFIKNEIENGGMVYIHCAGGIGRAPTMAAAYLISTGKSLDDALALIRKARPFVLLTPKQMEQLRAYETALRESQPTP
jgi:Dual specificity phosphatase, catalytic domain